MQRKDIDQTEFDDLQAVMTDARIDAGDVITTVAGTHPHFGALLLISAAGSYAVLGNDVHLIVGTEDSLEGEVQDSAAI